MVQAHVDDVYPKLVGSVKLLSDDGTEFKNHLFTDTATQLWVEFKMYSPPYHPQSKDDLKGFTNFSKHVYQNMYQYLFNGSSDTFSLCCKQFLTK